MADKPVAKVGLTFEVPLATMGATSVKQACDELRNRLLAYAEVLGKDRNVICQDIYVSQPGSALFEAKTAVADTTEARLKTVADKGNGHVAQPPKLNVEDLPKPKPAKAAKAKEVAADTSSDSNEDVDPPRVVAVPIAKKAVPVVEATAVANLPLLTTAQWVEKAVPHSGKRTAKTLALLTAMVEADGEVSADDIAKATKGDYANTDVASWLGQCLDKKHPYVVKVSRGKYKFVKEDKG